MHIIMELKNINIENIQSIKFDSKNRILIVCLKDDEFKYLLKQENGTFIIKYNDGIYATDLLTEKIN